MKRALVAVLLLVPWAAQATEPRAFGRDSWQEIMAAHGGQPTVVHLWGLTCAPCLVELPNWGKLAAERPDLRLVLIAADPAPPTSAQVSATLDRAGLSSIESWSFADRFTERLRYEIDPSWSGELPRTLLIAPNGERTVLSGIADLAKVKTWLDGKK